MAQTKQKTVAKRKKPASGKTKQTRTHRNPPRRENGKRKTKTTKESRTGFQISWRLGRRPAGILALLLAVFLLLAVLGMQGFVLSLLYSVVTGVIGWGIYPCILALFFISMLLLSNARPVRWRCVSLLALPVLWSSWVQCMLKPELYRTEGSLHDAMQEGSRLLSGGIGSGSLAAFLCSALSPVGARLLLGMAVVLLLFFAANQSPGTVWKWLRSSIQNEMELARLRREEDEQEQESAALPEQKDEEERTQRRQAQKRRLAEATPHDAAMLHEKQRSSPSIVDRNFSQQPRQEEEVEPVPQHPKSKVRARSLPAEEPATAEQNIMEQAREQMEREVAAHADEPVGSFIPPSISLLNTAPRVNLSNIDAEQQESGARLLDTLASFGIDAHIVDIIRGPAVTRFELQMERGVKFSRITSLSDDIALALGADSVRIAPIPDKLAIGIEVPNRTVQTVTIREVIASPQFQHTHASLAVALGKDITGTDQIIDLAKMPHLLIAGTTGSGKSVCINSILVSLLYKYSKDDVRLIMIDPKMVELGNYNGIPHLLIPVVTDPQKASGALNWAVMEMERRYALFAEEGVRNLDDYNSTIQAQQGTVEAVGEDGQMSVENAPQPLPKIVIVIDELADLMMVAAKEVETSICRIAQKARAAGMHLVVATQRPSADVITGIMKSNIPSRIAFAVASHVESRIILDTQGAEKLLGKGDMLYSPLELSKPMRIQGCFITTQEIERVINHVKSTGEIQYNQDIMEQIESGSTSTLSEEGGESDAYDELLEEAITLVVDSGQASVSMLQRRLKLGYSRAARIVDQMEECGIVGPFEGSKPRRVLISPDDWKEMQLRRHI